MSRSIPLEKALDDAMIALYQNGERLRPERLSRAPVAAGLGRQHEREVAAPHQGHRRADAYQGRNVEIHRSAARRQGARSSRFEMGVKVGDHAPRRMTMKGGAVYEISGLAWSGAGTHRARRGLDRRRRDLGEARCTAPCCRKRSGASALPWEWNGSAGVLQSRAHRREGQRAADAQGLDRAVAATERFHNNSIVSWSDRRTGA